MFRTQGGDFSFPYHQSGREVVKCKARVKDFFWQNKFNKSIYPLSWLIEKFMPVPGWTEEKIKALPGGTFKKLKDGGYYNDKVRDVL